MKRTSTRKIQALLLMAMFAAVTVIAQPVRTLIIDELVVHQVDGGSELELRFNFPVRYVRHFPAASGDTLQIVISPMPSRDIRPDDLRHRETIRLPIELREMVSEINYEGDRPGQPWIIINFNVSEKYEVRPGRDARSLLVLVRDPEAAVNETVLEDGQPAR